MVPSFKKKSWGERPPNPPCNCATESAIDALLDITDAIGKSYK